MPSNILLMDSLVIRYYIDDVWIYDDIGTPAHQDIENGILYLLNQEDDEDICESIAKFISDSSRLNRDSYSLIDRILRHKFETFKEVHDLLDKKNIKSLPKKIEIEDKCSLYNTEDDVEESDLDNLEANHEPSEVDLVDKENHNSSNNKESSEYNTHREKQRKRNSGEELLPPTKPKKSNSRSGMRHTGSSHSHHDNSKTHNKRSVPIEYKKKKLSLNSNRENVSPNDRKPVYVGTKKDAESNECSKQHDHATEIGNRGEDYVIEHAKDYVLSDSNIFDKAPTNNEGYDIRELDSDGEIVRYIEVKTLTGEWGEGGVAVTPSQLEFAQVYDNWWLFVVENINTKNTAIHSFKNPVQEANRFMFDNSWKQLATTNNQKQPFVPKVGDKYQLNDVQYEVVDIEAKGKLYKVSLRDIKTGNQLNKKFDHSWEKC